MPDIEIKRGYEVLPDNNIRFGIRITNISNLALSDVEVILDFTESLFKLEGERLQKVGVIPPANTRTIEFVLKPLACIHKVNIEALISYRDAKWQRYRIDMHPKEVHCVCPFLKGKKMPKLEFLELSGAGHSAEMGLNFKGVTVERLTSFLVQTCKIRHYKVDDFSIDGGRMLYLASESIGEKAYYLLTALIKEEDDMTQVMLRAVSDKPHGLNGFLNETVADLRHVVSTVQSAQEIGMIKKEQVINIIDSVVQRTTFAGGEGVASVSIEGSVVQHTEFKEDDGRKRREEERLRKEREEQERQRREEEGWRERREREEQERLRRQREEKERAKKEREEQEKIITNSIGMKFALVPAGEFIMGSKEYDYEKPVHKVTIKKPFYLGIYPVTQKEWKVVMGDNPSSFKGDNLPVEDVSWNDVQDFIKKLNEKEGANKYRLPTEAEWEYAARAGTTTRYSFGDSESELGDYAWYDGNSGSKTHEVGQKKPNPWGLYDMYGNVWEWVQDIYHSSYSGAPTDGSAWGGDGSRRVNRGGSWFNGAVGCRSAPRGNDGPLVSSDNIGFRLVRDV